MSSSSNLALFSFLLDASNEIIEPLINALNASQRTEGVVSELSLVSK